MRIDGYKVWLLVILAGSGVFNASAAEKNRGASIYNTTCVVCHGADGEGNMPGVSDLKQKDAGLYQSDALLMDRMLKGYQSATSSMDMPPKGGDPTLTESDLKEVLKYMRQEFQVSR
ncbi:MAG: c-type cytochrome [Gallionellaceae bacterium]|jgi:cytochrome c5